MTRENSKQSLFQRNTDETTTSGKVVSSPNWADKHLCMKRGSQKFPTRHVFEQSCDD